MAYVYFRVDSPYFYFRSYFAEYFQIIFGNVFVFGTYFGVMYLIGYHDFDESYIPYVENYFMQDYYPLYFLLPVALYVLYAVMGIILPILIKKVLRVNLSIRLCSCFSWHNW